jgi:hypothetical protein
VVAPTLVVAGDELQVRPHPDDAPHVLDIERGRMRRQTSTEVETVKLSESVEQPLTRRRD